MSSTTNRPRRLLGIAIALGCASLAGCGFQLRGATALPFNALFTTFAAGSSLGTEFRRTLRSSSGTRIVERREDCDAVLVALSERREKEVTVFSSTGRPREYQLRLVFSFAVVDPKGVELMRPTSLTLRRDITTSDVQLLSKEQEEVLLYREMQTDMVQQIMRRLSLIRMPSR